MMKLYGAAISPFSLRVMMQIDAKGLDIPVVPPPGGLHSPEYAAINPMNKIPALEIDGAVIPESQVICDLLEDLHPAPALRPDGHVLRARCGLLIRIVDFYVMNPMLPVFRNFDPATRDHKTVDQAVASVTLGLSWLDRFIAPGPYAIGDRLTLADCAAVPVLAYAERFMPVFGLDAPFAGKANIQSYWAAIRQDPYAARALRALNGALAGI